MLRPCRIALIRHAESHWNAAGRIQGQQDSGLTPRGRQQAQAWGLALRRYRWHQVLCSDLGRAVETAQIIARSLETEWSRDPRLREQDWGRWSGCRKNDIDPAALQAQIEAGWQFRPPGGESRLQVLERSLEALREAATGAAGKRLLVVTHEGVIKSLVYGACGRSFLPTEAPILLRGRLHWLSIQGDGVDVCRLNERIERVHGL